MNVFVNCDSRLRVDPGKFGPTRRRAMVRGLGISGIGHKRPFDIAA